MSKKIAIVFCFFYFFSITSAFSLPMYLKIGDSLVPLKASPQQDLVTIEYISKEQLKKAKKQKVTLDVSVGITDEDFNPINGFRVDEVVYYWVTFNRLGDLDVPYEELIGKEFRPKLKIIINRANWSIRLKTNKNSFFILTEEHANLEGIYFPLRLSDIENELGISIPPGKLKFKGKIKIKKVRCKKSQDKEKYRIVE
jgi:hypothetical protein